MVGFKAAATEAGGDADKVCKSTGFVWVLVDVDVQITYELFYRPEQSKYVELSHVGDMERRITDLEHLIGHGELQVCHQMPFVHGA